MQDVIRDIVGPLLDDAERVLGSGFAAVLYGSGARGEYLPGVSDVNLLLVGDSLRPETLRRLSGALQGLRHQRQAPPLLIERGEWDRAADVFPIEITDMRLAHEVLRGADPLTGLRVDPADLRSALEREFHSKLLRLRQVYAVHATDPRALGEVSARTISTVAALFRAALALHGREVPTATPACLTAAGAAMGITTAPLLELWGSRGRPDTVCPPERFEGYLSAVTTAVRVIDQFTSGGN
jgi:predicted nucleotidyltransferase